MGVTVSTKVDWSDVDDMLAELTGGTSAGKVVASAVKEAIDVHIRKDSGMLASTATATAWRVDYPVAYAEIVWGVPPQIVSPRNPLAEGSPHTNPIVPRNAAQQLAAYAARL